MDMISLIKNLKEEEIDTFIDKRLDEIDDKKGKVVGLNSDIYMYNGFFGENVRLNFGAVITEGKLNNRISYVGMDFDDKRMYTTLINEIKNEDNPYLATINAIDNYLLLKDNSRGYMMSSYKKMNADLAKYVAGKDMLISIELFHNYKNAICSQIAGVTQNMFRFLGIESDYVLDSNRRHAYNLFYPWGRENEAIIFDGMRPCTCKPYLFFLSKEKKEYLFVNNKVDVSVSDMNNAYKVLNITLSSRENLEVSYGLSNGYIIETAPDLLPSSTKHTLIFRNIVKED